MLAKQRKVAEETKKYEKGEAAFDGGSTMNESAFKPDWTSHPGESISDLLSQQGISGSEFAERIDLSFDKAQAILLGNLPIDEALSRKLSNLFGTSKEFWAKRQAKFELARSILSEDSDEPYLKRFPMREIQRLGWLHSSQGSHHDQCLGFFGVTSIQGLKREVLRLSGSASFRTSPTFSSVAEAVAVWLREAEIRAESLRCGPWHKDSFLEAVKFAKTICRRKSPQMFRPDLEAACAAAGVALVVLQAPKDCKASGATIIHENGQSLLVLSHRYRTDDHFWFSFFHEAAHILLHRNHGLIIEHDDDQSLIETEANAFASEQIVPISEWPRLERMRKTSMSVIKEAKALGISPGMLVGQLQHKALIPHNRLNRLKRKFAWD